MVCTFIGHRMVPENIKEKLRDVLYEMIEHRGVDVFYVGNQGQFDAMVYRELQLMQKKYFNIQCHVVLAYYDAKKRENALTDQQTIYPEGIETVPRRYAISWRNKWMICHSDFLIAYAVGESGNASTFMNWAKKKGLFIINLAD